jgi:hypothetical protein
MCDDISGIVASTLEHEFGDPGKEYMLSSLQDTGLFGEALPFISGMIFSFQC